jgi:hypothetical protein
MDEFYQNKNDPRYVKYFEKISRGVPKNVVSAEMIQNGLDSTVLE